MFKNFFITVNTKHSLKGILENNGDLDGHTIEYNIWCGSTLFALLPIKSLYEYILRKNLSILMKKHAFVCLRFLLY